MVIECRPSLMAVLRSILEVQYPERIRNKVLSQCTGQASHRRDTKKEVEMYRTYPEEGQEKRIIEGHKRNRSVMDCSLPNGPGQRQLENGGA